MIELSAANTRENTTGIELEAGLISFDGDRHGSNVGGFKEGLLIANGNILVAGDGGNMAARASGSDAGAVNCFVRIGLFSAETLVFDDIFESIVHQTTRAPVVAKGLRAVNEFLLGQREERAGLDEMSTFHGAGGGERPTAATLALVLDGSHSALGGPVNGGGGFDVAEIGNVARAQIRALMFLNSSNIGRSKFFPSQVAEFVHGHGVGGIAFIVGADEVEILLEDVESVEEFFAFVFLAMLFNPFGEQELVSLLRHGSNCLNGNEGG